MWSPSKLAAQRAAKRNSSAFALLNLWPFAAIMVALVAMFVGPHLQVLDLGIGPPIDLPKSQSGVPEQAAKREDAIHIFVTRDGAVYVERQAIPLKDVASVVQTAIQGGAEKKVYISADARAKNGDVERVVDELRRAGIAQIAFLTN